MRYGRFKEKGHGTDLYALFISFGIFTLGCWVESIKKIPIPLRGKSLLQRDNGRIIRKDV